MSNQSLTYCYQMVLLAHNSPLPIFEIKIKREEHIIVFLSKDKESES